MEKICIVKRRKMDHGRAPAPALQPVCDDEVCIELNHAQAERMRSNPHLSHLFRDHQLPQVFFNLHFRDFTPPRMLKPHEVCDILQVSISTLSKLARSGTIKSSRVGRQRRFSVEDVLYYLSGPLGIDRLNRLNAEVVVGLR